jgi:hypothetical protein
MEPTMKQDDDAITKAAREYVDAQLETMKRYGSAPNLTAQAYDSLVKKVVAATTR